jgi:hypothetical protein
MPRGVASHVTASQGWLKVGDKSHQNAILRGLSPQLTHSTQLLPLPTPRICLSQSKGGSSPLQALCLTSHERRDLSPGDFAVTTHPKAFGVQGPHTMRRLISGQVEHFFVQFLLRPWHTPRRGRCAPVAKYAMCKVVRPWRPYKAWDIAPGPTKTSHQICIWNWSEEFNEARSPWLRWTLPTLSPSFP